jgi:hypothetical protein
MDKDERDLVEAFRSMSDENRLLLLRRTRFALACEQRAQCAIYPPKAAFEPDYPQPHIYGGSR